MFNGFTQQDWTALRQELGYTDRCESGWTGDRCQRIMGHEGPHDNEVRARRESTPELCGHEECDMEPCLFVEQERNDYPDR